MCLLMSAILVACRKDVGCLTPDFSGDYKVTVRYRYDNQNGGSFDSTFQDKMSILQSKDPYVITLSNYLTLADRGSFARGSRTFTTVSLSKYDEEKNRKFCSNKAYRDYDGEITVGNDSLILRHMRGYSTVGFYLSIIGTKTN